MKKTVISFFLFTLCAFSVFAVSYGIEDYRVQVVVGRNAVHYVNEDITMNFYTPGHGFFRDIPVEFDGSPVRARVSDVFCNYPYESEISDGYYSMQIGDSDRKVQGLQYYNIRYGYDLGIDVNEGYDEFYFDLLGSGWECRTDSFSFEVYLPKEDLNPEEVSAWVTAGGYGSSVLVDYNVGYNSEFYVLYGTVSNLNPGEAVTIRIELPDGWYVGAREPWDLTPWFKIIAPYLSLVLVVIAFILWSAFGKDRKPVITARFEAPEGFSPMVVGYLIDGSVDDKDIISMIFNWADRGLLTINEVKKNKFTFTKLKDIDSDVPRAERDLFNGFFRGCPIGGEQTLSRIQQNNFADAMFKAKLAVAKYFTKDKALNSKKAGALGVLTGFASPIPMILFSAAFLLAEYSAAEFGAAVIGSVFVSLFSILNQWLLSRKWYVRKSNIVPSVLSAIPFVLSFAITFGITGDFVICFLCCVSTFALSVFAVIMGKKSEYGQKVFEEVLGFREFIDKVNMDELRMMIDKDPELYYRILSYAVVLGLEERWSAKFAGLAVPAPNWYIGSNVVDMMYFSHLSRRMNTQIRAYSMPSSAGGKVGGSGFRSTGFAGGGFGGGGGRAW